MIQFYVLVKYKNEPGAGYGRAYINADNNVQAYEMAKSMYGPLLISEYASPV